MTNVAIFNTLDCFLLICITFISLTTRLWLISIPESITFDEVYFGNFTNYYLHRTYFHDIHPPFAKLTMAFIAYLTGYKGHINFANDPKNRYLENEINYISLRLTPAIFQSFCFPLVYSTLRCLGFCSFTSFAASIAIIFEPSFLTEGRFILSDGILHFYSCLNMFALSIFIIDYEPEYLWFASLSLGAAISCKHTAFGLIAFDGISQLIWIYKFRPTFKEVIKRALLFLGPAICFFYFSYVIHFIILIYHGPKESFLSPEISKTLLKNGSYRGLNLYEPSLLGRIVYLVYITFAGHMIPLKPHPYESRPQYWPLLLDKCMIYSSFPSRTVMLNGSPLIYYPATFSLIIVFFSIIFRKADCRHFLLLSGWAFSYFPFYLIPRSMYLYHYLIPLIFSVMCQASIIETLFKENQTVKCFLLLTMIFCGISSFVFWYPTIYGTYCEGCLEVRKWSRFWFDSSSDVNITDNNQTVL